MNLEDLSPELKEKALNCKTPKELQALLSEEGYELSEDELATVSGGIDWDCWDICSSQTPCNDHLNDWC